MSKDFYSVLGVSKSASEDEIKNAFRKLAHQHHPDKQGGDAAKFKEINEAYQVLGNKEKRAKYDQFGSAAFDGSGGGYGGNPFGGFGGAGGFNPNDFGNINVDFGDLGDIFGSVFGGGGHSARGGRASRGADIQMDMDLTFMEAAFGVTKEVNLYKGAHCERCAGNGVEPGSKMNKCATCNGQGRVKANMRTMFGVMQQVRDCTDCDGRGEKPEKSCSTCHGEGIKKQNKTISLKIPAGVDEGGLLKLRNEGEPGPKGAPNGDLYVRIHVLADKRFDREGHTVISDQEIGFTTAALGGTATVETIHGPVELKIPAGTQSHTDFKLRGKGIEGDDHIVTIIVHVPTRLTKQQKKLLEEFEKSGE